MISYLKQFKPRGTKKEREWVQRYLGSDKPTKCIKTEEIVKLAGQITKKLNDETKLIKLVDTLYSQGITFEEIQLAGCILNRQPKLKSEVALTKLNYWLNFTKGWAETDILCQNGWDVNTILTNWKKWEKLLAKFSTDKNIHKRRASLVILVSLVRNSADQRLANLAFKHIEALKYEKEVLITKAISWILRALITYHKQEVADYLQKNLDTLPKIAIRETSNKLKTGKK